MKKNGKRFLLSGAAFLGAFVLWTLLIQIVDVQPVGQNGTDIGFAAFNSWFHKLIGVHMTDIRAGSEIIDRFLDTMTGTEGIKIGAEKVVVSPQQQMSQHF